jgi:hypothetical protein
MGVRRKEERDTRNLVWAPSIGQTLTTRSTRERDVRRIHVFLFPCSQLDTRRVLGQDDVDDRR